MRVIIIFLIINMNVDIKMYPLQIASVAWLFFISKIIDFTDTVRKSIREANFFHLIVPLSFGCQRKVIIDIGQRDYIFDNLEYYGKLVELVQIYPLFMIKKVNIFA